MLKLKYLIPLYMAINIVYIFTMVFNFNPLLRIKKNRDKTLCYCKDSNPRNIFLERLKLPAKNKVLEESVCSSDATRRGGGQKVISFSIFGENNTRYMRGLLKNVKAIKKYYPGQYIVRIYFDERRTNNKEFLCDVFCTEPNVDLCNVNDIGKSLAKSTIYQIISTQKKSVEKNYCNNIECRNSHLHVMFEHMFTILLFLRFWNILNIILF